MVRYLLLSLAAAALIAISDSSPANAQGCYSRGGGYYGGNYRSYRRAYYHGGPSYYYGGHGSPHYGHHTYYDYGHHDYGGGYYGGSGVSLSIGF